MAELVGSEAVSSDEVGAADKRASGRLGNVWGTFVLALVAMVSAIDRQSFSVLLVPIQKQIHVSDAAMGALTGTAFAVVYAVVAIPLARLADRTNRRNVLAGAVAVWSAATMACGLAGNYVQLLLARIAVGSAESAQFPASMSMIADMFAPTRRGAAIGVAMVGAAFGTALGAALAGYLNDRFNWHIALMAVGAPGLVLALVLFLTVREPARGAHDSHAAPAVRETLMQCLQRCARIRTLYPFTIGWVLVLACFSGSMTWFPVFLMRVHHLSATKMGGVFGSIIACSVVGAFVGGPISDWLAKRGARRRLYYCCAAGALSVPLLAASSLAPSLGWTIVPLAAYTLVSGSIPTALTATLVSFAPATMRSFMTAAMLLFGTVLGSGAAPALFGAVNDLLKQTYGDQSLRYTLLLAPAAMALAGVFLLVASRTLDRDVELAALPTPNL